MPTELNAASEATVAPIREALRAAEKIRALRFPDAEATPPSSVLPDLATRQGKILGFNATTGAPEAVDLPTSFSEIILGSDATGDIYYRAADGSTARLPVGTADQVLAVVSGIPAWVDASGGGGGVTLHRATTSTEYKKLTTDGATDTSANQIVITDNTKVHYKGTLVGAGENGMSYTASFEGLIARDVGAGNTYDIGTPSVTKGGSAPAGDWTFAIGAQAVIGGLFIGVATTEPEPTNWKAVVETIEISLP